MYNSNTKNVPPAVKNINELREKLEQREYEKEIIDWFLSLSFFQEHAT
jgi:hypothetical protein